MSKEDLYEQRRQIRDKMKANGIKNNALRLRGKPFNQELLDENDRLTLEIEEINHQLYLLGERIGYIL